MDAVGILKISLLSPQCQFFIGEIIFGDTKKKVNIFIQFNGEKKPMKLKCC